MSKSKRYRVTKKSLSVKIGGTPIGLMTHRELCHHLYVAHQRLAQIETQVFRLGALALNP